ncbi:hypothetical protein PHMEG_00031588 [Phytophthora megakarya]|uniref:PH domain-containing protein n=1 Tax=Phytophthora megakarya TaxID=4795 RepID=A0A225UXR3_9STRA|nr:hypothetical protein PHMEG_00031588 [Phytophthora megakarya]
MSDGQILRTGVLFKKGSGTGPFGRKNWKPRYFVLTPSKLQYFTFEDGELKGELSLQGCDEGVLEVMPADSMKTGSSASTIWRIAINAPERRLLVAAGTEMEMNDWVDKLVVAFRINSGQPPMQRASMPAPSSVNGNTNVNSNPSIRDFQNFSVPRRGINQRHSTGAEMRPSSEDQEFQAAQVESMKQQEWEKQQQRQEQRQAEQDAEMRRQLAAQQQREQEGAMARQEEEAQAAALAAAEDLQRQEEQEKQAQRQRAQKQKELEMQQAIEFLRVREAEEAARLHHEQEQEVIQNQRLADDLVMQEKLQPQQGEDLLELQRRQKREEHARQRAEHEKAVKMKMQQQQEQEDLAFRMTQQMNSHFSVDDDSDDSDHEPESPPMVGANSSPAVGSGPIGSGGLDDENGVRLSASQTPVTAPRSSLVGDVKREMIQKQQQEHQRRREATIKQEQQMRQQVEIECIKMETSNVRDTPREVEVAPREIEVVRRAPVKKQAAPPAAPMESFEF